VGALEADATSAPHTMDEPITVPYGRLFGTALAVRRLVRDGSLRCQLVAPDGYPRAVRRGLPVALCEQWASGGNPATEVASLKRDPAVTGIIFGTRAEISINGVSVFALAGKPVRGPLLLSRVNGRLPTSDSDIALGTTTLHQVGARIGSVVHVTLQVPTGGTRAAVFRVVGTVSFPVSLGSGASGPGRRSRSPAT
jgi:hypothetical protein